MDFTETFDKICAHHIFLKVQKGFDISGSLLSWLTNFSSRISLQVWLRGTLYLRFNVLSNVS